MKLFKYTILASILIFIFSTDLNAQLGIYLQIEIINSPKTIKFSSGDKINFKTVDYPDDWQKELITEILVDENVIVFQNDFIHIDQFTKLRIPNRGAQFLGKSLFTFGSAWSFFGILADLAGDFQFRGRELVIGASTIATGYTINKVFNYKSFNVKRGARLRIVDLRFSVD